MTAKDYVRASCGERFPRMHYACERLTREEFDHRVLVVGHDAPGKETVAVVVEVKQGVRYVFSNRGILQVACAGTAVKKLLYDRAGKALNLPALVGT